MAVLALAGWLLAVTAVVVAWGVRRGVIARVHEATRRVAPDRSVPPTPGLDGALSDLERAVERAGAAADAQALQLGQLTAALSSVPEALVVADASGQIVFRNAAAQLPMAPRHGRVLVEEAVGAMLAAALRGEGGTRTLELAGPPRRVLAVRAAAFEPSLGVGGALAVVEDVTERARLEAIRTDFVANISHELRTPVGAIGLLAETLVQEDDPEVTARLTQRILSEAHRVGRTIEDLLELSRIEVGARPSMDPVAVDELLAEAVERVRPAADLREIAVELSPVPAGLQVVGDRLQLVSAVTNLLENAVKYSDGGSSVELVAELHDGVVDLVVRDHGIGIPARDLERIFERFYRVDRARSRDTGGTGLGLAIVRHVAQNHDGEVTVTSVEGQGSTFTLHLPVRDAPAAAGGHAA